MRFFVLLLPLALMACETPDQAAQTALADTPERAITDFNGSTVTVDAKDTASAEGNLALARTACSGARLVSKTPYASAGIPVTSYLFAC